MRPFTLSRLLPSPVRSRRRSPSRLALYTLWSLCAFTIITVCIIGRLHLQQWCSWCHELSEEPSLGTSRTLSAHVNSHHRPTRTTSPLIALLLPEGLSDEDIDIMRRTAEVSKAALITTRTASISSSSLSTRVEMSENGQVSPPNEAVEQSEAGNRRQQQFSLLLSYLCTQYHSLPPFIIVLDGELWGNNTDEQKMMLSSILSLLSESVFPPAPLAYLLKSGFVNLEPGHYLCLVAEDDLGHGHDDLTFNLIIDVFYAQRPISSASFHAIALDVEDQPIPILKEKRAPGRLVLTPLCADRSRSYIIAREAVWRRQQAFWKKLYESNERQGAHGDLHKLVPYLFDEPIQPSSVSSSTFLFKEPLLSSRTNNLQYNRLHLITPSVNDSLSLSDTDISDRSSPHPLYKVVRDPALHRIRTQLIVAPSSRELYEMNTDASSARKSEQRYSWLRGLPLGLEPQTVQLTVLVHRNFQQEYDQTLNLRAVQDAQSDAHTLDLLANFSMHVRHDTPQPEQFIDSTCELGFLATMPPSMLFLRYLINQFNFLSMRPLIAFKSSYSRYVNDIPGHEYELHHDWLQRLVRANWGRAESDRFMSLDVDSYVCEHDLGPVATNPSASELKRTRIREVRLELMQSLFLISKQIQYPPSLCYYAGGNFIVSLPSIIRRKVAVYERVYSHMCKRMHDRFGGVVSVLDMAELLEEAISPLWQISFHPASDWVMSASAVSFVNYGAPSTWLISHDALMRDEGNTSSLRLHHAIVSGYSHEEQSFQKKPHWLTSDVKLAVVDRLGQSRQVSVVLLSALYNEDELSFLTRIDPHFRRVLVRQIHPLVKDEPNFGLDIERVRQLQEADNAVPDSIVLHSRGMCKEGSSYLSFIVSYYHTLPDYIIFMHGQSQAWHHIQPIEDVINHLDWSFILSNSLVNDTVDSNTSKRPFYHNLNSAFYTLVRPDHFLVLARHWRELRLYENSTDLSETIPELIGFHQAAQFIVEKAAITRRPLEWWNNLYLWCRHTTLTPTMASRIMEYTWHMSMGQAALEPRHVCGTISHRENCILTKLLNSYDALIEVSAH